MKTIEQLLELSENPYYKFSQEEEQELNAFLLKKREEASKRSAQKNSKKSDSNTAVTADDLKTHSTNIVKVRNVVKKTVPHTEESGE